MTSEKEAGTLRIFWALPIQGRPAGVIQQTVEHITGAIPESIADAWEPASGLHHITLRFLGDSSLELTGAMLRKGLEHPRPFALGPGRVDCFREDGSPSVIYAGVQGDLRDLAELQAQADQAAAADGYSPTDHPFHPHITLGRLNRALTGSEKLLMEGVIQDAEEFLNSLEKTGWWAHRGVLMQTLRENGGSRYGLVNPADHAPVMEA